MLVDFVSRIKVLTISLLTGENVPEKNTTTCIKSLAAVLMQYPVSCRLTLKGEEDTMEFATKCIHEIGAADATCACLGALDAWLVIRGIKTLPLRMEQHQKNAFAIAKWLQEQPRVQYVLYPGLENHPGYVINKAQTTGFGGMISFAVDSAETARQILEGVKLIKFSESLGGTESLITYPIRQTHTDLTAEECAEKGITDCLLRFSTGIEATQDLIDDLAQAFAAVE